MPLEAVLQELREQTGLTHHADASIIVDHSLGFNSFHLPCSSSENDQIEHFLVCIAKQSRVSMRRSRLASWGRVVRAC